MYSFTSHPRHRQGDCHGWRTFVMATICWKVLAQLPQHQNGTWININMGSMMKVWLWSICSSLTTSPSEWKTRPSKLGSLSVKKLVYMPLTWQCIARWQYLLGKSWEPICLPCLLMFFCGTNILPNDLSNFLQRYL